MWGRGEGMKREGVKDKERPKLFHSGERGEERKITEYIDFFYSLHHLYKYIEPQKTKKTSEKNNSAIQKPTTAVRQTESKRGESSESIHERDRGAEKDRRQYETWQEKGVRGGLWESRESAQLCV